MMRLRIGGDSPSRASALRGTSVVSCVVDVVMELLVGAVVGGGDGII